MATTEEHSLTDLERFRALFDSVDQSYDDWSGDELKKHSIGDTDRVRRNGINGHYIHTVLKFAEHKHGQVAGYSRFYTCFYFDAEGKYLGMGVWE